MSEAAQKLIHYLQAKGFNTPQETAKDCGLDEVELDAVIDEIEEAGDWHVNQSIRPDSYGAHVMWLSVCRITDRATEISNIKLMPLDWDETWDMRKRYTHEIDDGTITYKVIARGWRLVNVAQSFAMTYNHGENDAWVKAHITDLSTGSEIPFEFCAHYFFWNR